MYYTRHSKFILLNFPVWRKAYYPHVVRIDFPGSSSANLTRMQTYGRLACFFEPHMHVKRRRSFYRNVRLHEK